MLEIGRTLGKQLGVTSDLLEIDRNVYAVFMILQSARVTKEREMCPQFYEKLGPLGENLKQNYFKIFFENSSKKRLVFFCEPLVQQLWTTFRQ